MEQTSLTRTPLSTLRWYLTSRLGKFVTVGVAALVLAGGVAWQWPAVSSTAHYVMSVATAVVEGEELPAPGEQPNDPTALLAAQADLFDQLTVSRAAVAGTTEFSALRGAAARVESRANTCDQVRTSAKTHVLTACTLSLAQLTAPLLESTVKARADADIAAALERAEKEAEAKRKADAMTQQPKPAPRPAPKPAPAPAPVKPSPPKATPATVTVRVNCDSISNAVTFAATGSGTVKISVSGAASGGDSGSGSAATTVHGGKGTYTATATGSGGKVNMTASWDGSCSA